MEVRERMKNIPIQTTLAEYSEEYKAFVEKFKPKKTTDDCYTPDNVYEAVLEWVCERYDVTIHPTTSTRLCLSGCVSGTM